MKKITSILLAFMLIVGVCGSAMLTVGAGEATSDTWDGTASVKWYLDGPNADDEYELKTAEDLAGLAFLVGAANAEGRYVGVYYRADGIVAGYVPGSNDTAYRDTAYLPTSVTGLEKVDGDTFLGKTVVLTVDIVLNEGNAADWATTAPANVWQPIGGNIKDGGKRAGFDGLFDGKGHTVSGLYCKAADAETLYGGLFGVTGQQFLATIQNLNLTNFYVCGDTVGALVGRSNKGLMVNNVHISNGISETQGTQAGAIVGAVFGGSVTFQNCSVESVAVQGNRYLGIFTGITVSQTLDISNCYVKDSTVKGDGQVGLVCGRMAGGNIAIRNVYAIVELEATGEEVNVNSRLAGAGLVYGVAGDNNKPAAQAIESFFHVSTVTGTVINEDMAELATAVELTQITGEMAMVMMPSFDYETVWKIVEGDTPVIELRGGAEEGGDDDDDDFLPGDGGDSGDNGGNDSGNNAGNNNNNNNDGNNGGATNNGGNTNTETNAPETEPSTTDDSNGGCGSAIGLTGFMLIAVASGAAIMLKKEN